MRLNFKTGTAAWLILLAAWLLTGYALYLIIGLRFQAYAVAAGVCSALMLMEMILMIYSFAVLSRFEMKLGGLLKNAAVLAVRHPGHTLFMLTVTLVMFTMAVGYAEFWPLYLIFLPGCYMLVLSLALEPVFAPYMPEEVDIEEETDIEDTEEGMEIADIDEKTDMADIDEEADMEEKNGEETI